MIADVAEAQIKLWVLTGDKMQTAINIGYSCNLLDKTMHVSTVTLPDGLNVDDEQEFAAAMIELEVALLNALSAVTGQAIPSRLDTMLHVLDNAGQRRVPEGKGEEKGEGGGRSVDGERTALVITGKALELIMPNSIMRKLLLDIGLHVHVVIACRVSPAQKAELVDLVKKGVKPTPITLAIGDGANDCPMIQAAHVGVGISGQEGRQAFNASDFGIAQFRFLRRLLLLHGRWNYRRMCKVIVYVFYKNFCVTLCMFYFTFLSGFSGQSVFEEMMYTGFNIFTMFSIISTGVVDQDVKVSGVRVGVVVLLTGGGGHKFASPRKHR